MSFKPEVQVHNDPKWYNNALCFATREEAEANARDLRMRWLAVVETRAAESDDTVNYEWVDGALKAVETGGGW